jgi:aconitate hydratase
MTRGVAIGLASIGPWHMLANGSLGLLPFRAGGIDLGLAIAGRAALRGDAEELGARLDGSVANRVSATNVILELLQRQGVAGRIIDYQGAMLAGLSAMERPVLANMAAELGVSPTAFRSDSEIRRYLESEG